MKKLITTLTLSFVFVACGSVPAGDLDPTGTAPPAGTSTPPPAAGPVDNDGDGVLSSKDCNDNNVAIHPYMTEACNGKDDNCNLTVDEGCASTPSGTNPTGTAPTADTDKDGYPDGPSDCAPMNAAVHPGQPEACGNGVDDNCDGVIDENCSTPAPSGTTTAKVELTYPDSVARTLNVQVYDDKSDLGGWWDKSVSSTTTALTVDLAALPTNVCGFRINVTEGNPASSWLCAGNGSTASLDPDAQVKVTFNGQTYGKAQLMTWSPLPLVPTSGCSALLKVNSAAACQP